jgi:hypothetical protein
MQYTVKIQINYVLINYSDVLNANTGESNENSASSAMHSRMALNWMRFVLTAKETNSSPES